MEQRGNIRFNLPGDGYEWKKYGQKFIRGIGKFRYIYILSICISCSLSNLINMGLFCVNLPVS